ncbi:SCO3374 family protein [Streptomyces sp. NPDC088387]|uniref:SCO3374 family protein n=1 Tax=Streptomyces sp. NPDC088387 TaxID=3365859 RepID=UPI0037FC6C11
MVAAFRPNGTAVPAPTVPAPRRPSGRGDAVRRWYERDLGWPTAPGDPVRLRVGARFDVLDVPAEAGRAALRHLVPGSPVAVRGDRLRLLVAAGSAEELPGLLEWLEWGTLALDLVGIGAGGLMRAPLPPRSPESGNVPGPSGVTGSLPDAGVGGGSAALGIPAARAGRPDTLQGAAVWLRPPEPGCEVEASLPTLSAVRGAGGAPDFVRLVDTVANHCHRIRLRRSSTQALAFS